MTVSSLTPAMSGGWSLLGSRSMSAAVLHGGRGLQDGVWRSSLPAGDGIRLSGPSPADAAAGLPTEAACSSAVASGSLVSAAALGGLTGAALVASLQQQGLQFMEDRGRLRLPFSSRMRPLAPEEAADRLSSGREVKLSGRSESAICHGSSDLDFLKACYLVETPLSDPSRAALADLHWHGYRLEREDQGIRVGVGPFTAASLTGPLWVVPPERSLGRICLESPTDLPACQALTTGGGAVAQPELAREVGEVTRSGYVFYEGRALDPLQAYRRLESGGELGLGIGYYGPLDKVKSATVAASGAALDPLRRACREQLEPALLQGRLAASCLGYVLQVLQQPVAGRSMEQRANAFLQALDLMAREHPDRAGDRWFLTVKALQAYGEIASFVGTGEAAAVREEPDFVIIGAVRVPRRG